MPDNARWRLSVMMFLEYVIWGSWLPLLALYLSRFLGFSGTEIGWIFATQAIASVTARVRRAASSPTATCPRSVSWPSAT